MPNEPKRIGAGKLTLVAIVGPAVALALGYAIPREESGRTVKPSIGSQNELVLQHVGGKQYLQAYLDMVGVATACDGLTSYQGRKITKNDHFVQSQCTTMLETELIVHAKGVMACSPGLAISTTPAIEERRQAPRFAAVSLAYNMGVGSYCHSTARLRFNEGRYTEGCQALRLWNKAGGRVVQGLVKRRDREAAVCLFGLGALK